LLLTMEPTPALSLVVRDAATSAAITRYAVRCWAADRVVTNLDVAVRPRHSGIHVDGRLLLADLIGERQWLVVEADGYQPSWPRCIDLLSTTGRAAIEVELRRGTELRGTVRGSGGRSQSGIRVEAVVGCSGQRLFEPLPNLEAVLRNPQMDPGAARVVAQTTIAGDGSFRLDALAAGPLFLRVCNRLGVLAIHGPIGLVSGGESVVLDIPPLVRARLAVEPPEAIRYIDALRLTRKELHGTRRITYQLRDRTLSIQGSRVLLYDTPEGVWTVEGIRRTARASLTSNLGNIELTASAADGEQMLDASAMLPRVVRGWVRGPVGLPLAGTCQLVGAGDQGANRSSEVAQVDAAGHFEVEIPIGGEYRLRVTPEGNHGIDLDARPSLQITSSSQEILIELDATCSAAGLRFEDGTPARDEPIALALGGRLITVRTDHDGRLCVWHAPDEKPILTDGSGHRLGEAPFSSDLIVRRR
jgi:hypothetical protein